MTTLVDSDVLIWHLRGHARATQRLDKLATLRLSAVSHMEVVQGVRNKAELAAWKRMLQRRNAVVLTRSEPITQRAIAAMEAVTLSHGLQMGDALIAATALEHKLAVLTCNARHFAAVEGLQVEMFVP